MSEPHQAPFKEEDLAETVHLKALRVENKLIGGVQKKLKGLLLQRPRVKNVVVRPADPAAKLVLLSEAASTATELPQAVAAEVAAHPGVTLEEYDLHLTYAHLTTEAALRRLLPPGVEPPSSYEQVGHIAHLNLRDEQLPHKAVIGRVLLDKNPTLRTIVNKVGAIDSEYRVFRMELLAGDSDTVALVKQFDSRFRLDFAKVYWNSRLEAEHARLVGSFHHGATICDMMAGIGPFAIPAAQKGCRVYANDLNPDSVHWLRHNVGLNGVATQVSAFRLCARAFLRLLCDSPGRPSTKELEGQYDTSCTAPSGEQAAVAALPEGFQLPAGGVVWQHTVMNLPASAEEFLDAFNGAFDPDTWNGRLPMVHCYMFGKAEESEADLVARCEHHLGASIPGATLHLVRKVAPNKDMYCCSFQLPPAAAFNGRDNSAKRLKVAMD